MARPRENEREDIKGLVLEKAKELFLTVGYNNITMRRIAKEIRYSPGSIYLYFRNKEEILFELHNAGFRLLYQYKLSLIDSGYMTPLERLYEGGKVYIKFALENPEYYELMFNMPEPRDYLQKLRETQTDIENHIDYAMQSYEFLKESIRLCMEEGYIQKIDLDLATFSFWSIGHGAVSLIIRKRIPYPQEASHKLAEEVIGLFMNSIVKK